MYLTKLPSSQESDQDISSHISSATKNRSILAQNLYRNAEKTYAPLLKKRSMHKFDSIQGQGSAYFEGHSRNQKIDTYCKTMDVPI